MWPNNLLEDAQMDDIDLLFSLLPRSESTVLRLFYQEGLTPSEIATRLGISSNHAERIRAHAWNG